MTDRDFMESLQRELIDLRRQAAAQGQSSHRGEGVAFRLARVVADNWPSTSSTTTSSTSTTAPPATSVRIWNILFVDAQFPKATGIKTLSTIERSQTSEFAAARASLAIAVGDLVAVIRDNDRWWIVATYGPCPQGSAVTTTTTTTTPHP